MLIRALRRVFVTHRPVPFIVGVGRSGTTLLRMMLDAHPDLAIPPETGFIPSLPQAAARGQDLREAFRSALVAFPTWPDFQLSMKDLDEVLAAVEPFRPDDAVRALYLRYAARFGKRRWGDKTPTYCMHMAEIEALLPEARFLHIIRDGRDVALSVRGLWFSPGSDVESIARDWRDRIVSARAQGARRRHYQEVRYEELVAEPETVLRRVCAFAKLDFDPAMLHYHERAGARLTEHGTRLNPDGSVLITQEQRAFNQRFTTKPPEPSRVGRWRTEMPAEEQARFQAVAGALLSDLGYAIP